MNRKQLLTGLLAFWLPTVLPTVASPVMGRNSWDTFHVNVSDTLIRTQADTMARLGLKDVDYTHTNMDVDFSHWRDSAGVMHFHPRRFPNGKKVVVTHLTVEGRMAPLGLDVEAPRLGWQIVSDQKAVVQKSYRIVVSSTYKKASQCEGDIWDSGKVKSSQSQWVELQGLRLQPNREYYWTVRVQTNKGTSGWTAPQKWSMGMMGTPWKGYWIGTDSLFAGESVQEHSRIAARYLRKAFKTPGEIRRATLHVCGLGLYQLHLNGRRIGNGVLAPLSSEYGKTLIYDTYDVTHALSSENVMQLTLQAGNYFAPRQHYQTNVRSTYGMPTALLNLIVEYQDGRTDTLATDDSWRLNVNGPIRYSNLYDGEMYDATRNFGNVFNSQYDDQRWVPAQRMQSPMGKLVGNLSQPITIYRKEHPLRLWKVADKRYLIDFGTNGAGRVRIQLQGLQRQDTVRVRYAELLGEDGNSLYTLNLRSAENLDTYISDGEETAWTSEFTYHGFRYAEVEGIPSLVAEMVTRELIADEMNDANTHFYIEENGKPSLLNKLVDNARRGIRSNYKGFPIDCPQRDERMPWLGDRTTGCLGESYLMDNHSLYAKWMKDIGDAQRSDGNISDVSPSYWRLYTNNVTWPAAYPFGCDMLYRQYGDLRPFAEHYASIKKYLSYMKTNFCKDGLITRDKYGDWCMPPERLDMIFSKDSARITNGELISSCYYAYLCRMMAAYAGRLGRPSEGDGYQKEAEEMVAAINRKYLKDGKYDNNTATANLLPLAMGYVPEDSKAAVERNLLDVIAANDGHVSCGVIGIQWLMRYLADCGRNDLAYKMATQTSYPSWGYMIAHGATTIWELWNGNTANPAMNSGNHVMLLGDLLPWCYERLGGIRPKKPGFEDIEITPDFSLPVLNRVEVSHPSPYGVIKSRWDRDAYGKIKWEVAIPANTAATLVMPDGKTVNVKSGNYHFVFPEKE